MQHEEEELGGETGFVAYEKRFWYPSDASGSKSKLYYSYEAGPAHITMLGCYAEYGPDSPQMAWLRRDLSSVDRSRTPWLIVGMHVRLLLEIRTGLGGLSSGLARSENGCLPRRRHGTIRIQLTRAR